MLGRREIYRALFGTPSDSGITDRGYNGEKVHYWYEDHQTKQRVDKAATAYRFIHEIVQHISPKHFEWWVDTQIEMLVTIKRGKKVQTVDD